MNANSKFGKIAAGSNHPERSSTTNDRIGGSDHARSNSRKNNKDESIITIDSSSDEEGQKEGGIVTNNNDNVSFNNDDQKLAANKFGKRKRTKNNDENNSTTLPNSPSKQSSLLVEKKKKKRKWEKKTLLGSSYSSHNNNFVDLSFLPGSPSINNQSNAAAHGGINNGQLTSLPSIANAFGATRRTNMPTSPLGLRVNNGIDPTNPNVGGMFCRLGQPPSQCQPCTNAPVAKVSVHNPYQKKAPVAAAAKVSVHNPYQKKVPVAAAAKSSSSTDDDSDEEEEYVAEKVSHSDGKNYTEYTRIVENRTGGTIARLFGGTVPSAIIERDQLQPKPRACTMSSSAILELRSGGRKSGMTSANKPLDNPANNEKNREKLRITFSKIDYLRLPDVRPCFGNGDNDCKAMAVTRPVLEPGVDPAKGEHPNTHCLSCALDSQAIYTFLGRNCANEDGVETWKEGSTLCAGCELEKPCKNEKCEETVWGLGRALCLVCELEKPCKNEKCEETVWKEGYALCAGCELAKPKKKCKSCGKPKGRLGYALCEGCLRGKSCKKKGCTEMVGGVKQAFCKEHLGKKMCDKCGEQWPVKNMHGCCADCAPLCRKDGCLRSRRVTPGRMEPFCGGRAKCNTFPN